MNERNRTKPSAHDVRRLAVQAELHPNTVGRVYTGRPVRWLTVARVARAARELGLPEPKDPTISERVSESEEPDVH